MPKEEIAREVLAALGGRSNILTNTVCMTRLRVTLKDPQAVGFQQLNDVPSVLGTATRGSNGLEVVFGPRIIDGVYRAFIQLTGIEAGTDALFPMSRQESNIRVQISPGKRAAQQSDTEPSAAQEQTEPPATADDQSMLQNLMARLSDDEQSPPTENAAGLNNQAASASVSSAVASRSILVINGPNLNMLGIREPDFYGKEDYPALLELCKRAANEAGFARCDCFQSNHEGDLVDVIQDAYGVYDGIVINPGAYTHTSVALLDALKAVSIPAVEVHISKVSEREDFRQVSYIRAACFKTITGMGIDGYRQAMYDLALYLANA